MPLTSVKKKLMNLRKNMALNKFRTGQLVKCIDPSLTQLTLNKLYIIQEAHNNFVKICDDNNNLRAFINERFVEATFNERFKYKKSTRMNELKITKEKVLEAASNCPQAKETLKTLFPEVFKKEKLNLQKDYQNSIIYPSIIPHLSDCFVISSPYKAELFEINSTTYIRIIEK